jgi:glyoxylase-like metal-dependent hydrolase (beta-lactamase superfamily II)
MKLVPEFSTVRSGLFHWQGYDSAVKCDCSSTAVVTSVGLVFIDPVLLEEEALKELVAESFSTPSAIVLTSGNHQRESLRFSRRFGIPIFAPEGAELVAESRFVPGEPVAGLDTVPLPGFGPCECALLTDGVLIFGDALINLEPEGLRLLPEKYREDVKRSLRSLASLGSLHPEVLMFAHGLPVVREAAARLAAVVSGAFSGMSPPRK